MGWNTIKPQNSYLFKGLVDFSRFYFVHSYYFNNHIAENIISTIFKPIKVFIVAGSIYLFMTFIIHNLIQFLERKYGF